MAFDMEMRNAGSVFNMDFGGGTTHAGACSFSFALTYSSIGRYVGHGTVNELGSLIYGAQGHVIRKGQAAFSGALNFQVQGHRVAAGRANFSFALNYTALARFSAHGVVNELGTLTYGAQGRVTRRGQSVFTGILTYGAQGDVIVVVEMRDYHVPMEGGLKWSVPIAVCGWAVRFTGGNKHYIPVQVDTP